MDTPSKHRVRPTETIVYYRGAPWKIDIVKCRRALVHRQVEGLYQNMASLVAAANVSRSTASRFFSGKSTSLAASLRILKALKLEFEEEATPAGAEEAVTAGTA